MPFMRRLRAPVSFLSGLMFLLASGLGLHVHLCFDGQELPASVHAAGTGHLDHPVDEVHEDVDLEPMDNLLAKSFAKLDLSALALFAVLLFLLSPQRDRVASREYACAPRAAVRRWRPPPRAPPR